jgi:hypothetical protein
MQDNSAPDPDREPPLRYIGKREGVRHVLHAAIRSVFYGEDPFAIHLLGQSAEKVLLDLLENAKIEDPFFSLLKPEVRSEFFEFYREPYNFLKHADRDSDGKLAVRNIVASNDLPLYCCIHRYRVLFGAHTQHMSVFSMFVETFYPKIVELNPLPPMKKLVEATGSLTRGELLTQIWSCWQRDPTLQQERQEDLIDVANANASRRTA